jgi:hypothetical protein
VETRYLDNNVTLTVTRDYEYHLTPLPGWGFEYAVEVLESVEWGGGWMQEDELWTSHPETGEPTAVAKVIYVDKIPMESKARIHG